jgi:kynurenine formamidase
MSLSFPDARRRRQQKSKCSKETWMDLAKAKVYDLAQPYFAGMPHHPNHPPFLMTLAKRHGDYVAKGEVSSASEAIGLGGHVGTHIDALCHFSCGGKLHGGVAASDVQSFTSGFVIHSVDTIAPIVRHGVLLDIAGQQGTDSLPADFEITSKHLERAASDADVEIGAGDVVLLRTGWAQFWEDPVRYITGGTGSEVRGPGPQIDGARWLSSRRVFAAGSDTIAFERVPDPGMPVHVHLLVESGIHLIEALNLEELARDRVYSFWFVAAPLKIRGGTGAPVRPLALRID